MADASTEKAAPPASGHDQENGRSGGGAATAAPGASLAAAANGDNRGTSANVVPWQKTPSPRPDAHAHAHDTMSPASRALAAAGRFLQGPPWTRWDAKKPPTFSVALNLLFAFAGAFTVANLYYNQPILDILAREFDVDYETVSRIPTLAQAGYCVGLFLLCPLGDWVRRRPFVLCLMFVSAAFWIPLCITSNFETFLGFQFVSCVFTVTPQLMLPLVGDLSPPHRRALALSIVSSGNVLGILLARILSGIVTQYTSWRNIYWLALGLQYALLLSLWAFMPDYPRTNRSRLNYPKLLWSMVAMYGKHPVLVQASIVGFAQSATFTCFWTTLTFLLSGDPYHYSTLVIGLFALIGLAAIMLSPLYAKYLIDRYVPLFSAIVGMLLNLVGLVIGTYTGTFTIAGPIILALFLDAAFQVVQIANRSAIYAVDPNGRNRVNTGFMVSSFCGQLTGTAAGNHLYARGGWYASGSLSVGLAVFALLVMLARGPYEDGWVGWSGGFAIRKRDRTSADGRTVEREMHNTAKGDRERARLGSIEKALEEAATTAQPAARRHELERRRDEQEAVVRAEEAASVASAASAADPASAAADRASAAADPAAADPAAAAADPVAMTTTATTTATTADEKHASSSAGDAAAKAT